jgi:hypothetical protein
MFANTCVETDSLANYTWLLLVTILCAIISLLLELIQILETLKIVTNLKNAFQKKDDQSE